MSPEPTQPTKLLSTKEAARLLGLAAQTLRRWRCRGSGPPFVKLSTNRVAYRAEALENFVADREYESTSDESAAAACRRPSSTS